MFGLVGRKGYMGFLDKMAGAGIKIGSRLAKAQPSEAAGIKAKAANVAEYMKAVSGEPAEVKALPATANVDKVGPRAKFGDRPGERRPGPDGMPSYKDGVAVVPKTGPAMLHKNEAVVPAKDNPMSGTFDLVKGKRQRKAKKELEHMRVRKAKSGGMIVEHHYTNSGDHKMEEHVMKDLGALHSHMDEHYGEPKPEGADVNEQTGTEAMAQAVGE
jgi:hypothetical protein